MTKKTVLVFSVMLSFALTGYALDNDSGGKDGNSQKLHSMTVAIGTGFGSPCFIANVHATFAPFKHFFIEPGVDLGLWQLYKEEIKHADGYYYTNSDVTDIASDSKLSYHSFYPYIHLSSFFDLSDKAGLPISLYGGLGCGIMFATYTSAEGVILKNTAAMDYLFGFIIKCVDVSLTFRTDYKTFNPKLQIGYIYRIQ